MTLQEALKKANLKVKILCDVRDGSLVCQHEPYTGTTWLTIPGTEARAGSYYQEVSFTWVPPDHPIFKNLPSHCWVEGEEDY